VDTLTKKLRSATVRLRFEADWDWEKNCRFNQVRKKCILQEVQEIVPHFVNHHEAKRKKMLTSLYGDLIIVGWLSVIFKNSVTIKRHWVSKKFLAVRRA